MKNLIRVLLLAGGASIRMGQPKALLPWGKSSVLRHILNQIRLAGCSQVLVVTGAHHAEIERDLRNEEVALWRNANWENGMGSSLSSGLQELRRLFPGNGKVLILLVDQPLVDTAYLKRLISRSEAEPERIVATTYHEGPGVPALFPSEYLDILQGLNPRQGARAVLRNPEIRVSLLDPGEKAVDIDTPEAYRELRSKFDAN